MNPLGEDQGAYWPRQTGMVMTKVWDPDPEAAQTFADMYDVEVVDNYYDMVDSVDGVIMSDYYATGWWPELSKPYLEAGIPCLINRPFALSLDEAEEMIERSRMNNTPILVPSGDEYLFETIQGKTRVQELISRGAVITGVMAFEPCGEYPAHGVHAIYNIHKILEPQIIAAGLHAEKWWEWGAKGALMDLEFKGIGGEDFYGSIRMGHEYKTNGWVMVSTSLGRVFVPNDHAGEVFTRYNNLFRPTVVEFQRLIETREMPHSYDYIMEKTKTFLTGFYSHVEKGGAMVNATDVPKDWRAPEVMPERIPDDIFRG
jgi:hypothetical protein